MKLKKQSKPKFKSRSKIEKLILNLDRKSEQRLNQMGHRFERRFEQMDEKFTQRFNQVDQKFIKIEDQLNKHELELKSIDFLSGRNEARLIRIEDQVKSAHDSIKNIEEKMHIVKKNDEEIQLLKSQMQVVTAIIKNR